MQYAYRVIIVSVIFLGMHEQLNGNQLIPIGDTHIIVFTVYAMKNI
jgi:hypothetical protein